MRVPIYTFFSEAELYVNSVCVVTIIRLILSVRFRLDDLPYSFARISIFTILEPLLGIIIACLPLFRPAIRKAAESVKNTHPETPNILSSSLARIRLMRSKGTAFKRVDDSLLFTDLEDNRTKNHINGPGNESECSVDDHGHAAVIRILPQSSIRIDRDWNVRSEEAGHLAREPVGLNTTHSGVTTNDRMTGSH